MSVVKKIVIKNKMELLERDWKLAKRSVQLMRESRAKFGLMSANLNIWELLISIFNLLIDKELSEVLLHPIIHLEMP